MKKFLFGLTFGLLASATAASAAFPAQVAGTFASGQVLLASSLEDLRAAVNGMLGAFDASGNVAASKVATGSSFRFVTDAEKSSWSSKLDTSSPLNPANVSTGSSFRFVTDAQVSSWDSKLGASSVIPAAQVLTGSSFRFVTDAEKSAWNSKISSASGATFVTLSGGTVPLAQLPPVFDVSGLNVLASAVATSAGARFSSDAEKASWDAKYGPGVPVPVSAVLTGSSSRFVTDAQISSWNAKLGTASLIDPANVFTGSLSRFVTDAQIAGWNNKLDMATAAVSFVPLSGGTIPAQFLPAASDADVAAGTGAQLVTAAQLNAYAVGTVGTSGTYEYRIKELLGGAINMSGQSAFMKRSEYVCKVSGTFLFRLSLSAYGGSNDGHITAQIYKNGLPYGASRGLTGHYGTATSEFAEALTFVAGDKIQVYASDDNGYPASVNYLTVNATYVPAEIRKLGETY